MNKQYRQCKTCVMDTTDPSIIFYDDGTCSHCRHAIKFTSRQTKRYQLSDITQYISDQYPGDPSYHTLIGLSGGVDSTWLLHLLSESNLRLYVHHVDTGWNSPEAVSNIYTICDNLGIRLHTHVVDWDLMRKMQVAFFYSGVINQDIPQDIAIFSSQVRACIDNGISTIASGANNTTESILPSSWGHHWHDVANLYSIFQSFWRSSVSSFPYCNFPDLVRYRLNIHQKFNSFNILDLINYEKKSALESLENIYGYQRYPHKHGESLWTLYYQTIYLPSVFGIDKRRAHLSNLIVNGDMTRFDALNFLDQPIHSASELIELSNLVAAKLRIPFEHVLDPGSYVLRCPHESFGDSKQVIDNFTSHFYSTSNDVALSVLDQFIECYQSRYLHQ